MGDSKYTIEGVDIDDVIEEESYDEDGYGLTVDKMNESLMNDRFKEYIGLFGEGLGANDEKKKGRSAGDLKGIFSRREGKVEGVSEDVRAIVEMDRSEVEVLVDSIKSATVSMRLKAAKMMEDIRNSEADPAESISLVNLRVEVLADYMSYICLLCMMKVCIGLS